MKIFAFIATTLLSLTITASEPNLSELMQKRYSGYQYDASKQVTALCLQQILEAARLTPSSYNEQPWHIIVCDQKTTPESYQKAFSTLVEFNQNWSRNAPVLIIVMASNTLSKNGNPNRFAEYDTGAAVFAMALRATSLGLMTHQMGGFDETKLQKDFSIPKNFVPLIVMAVGYPKPDETTPEKKRKALGENFFLGTWGTKF